MRLIPLVLFSLVACGPDPELVKEKDALAQQVGQLTQEKERVERERDALRTRAERLQREVDDHKRREVYTKLKITEGQKLTATLDTTLGVVTCELWPEKSPKTVLNFVELAEGTREWTEPKTGEKVKRPLYDGTIFHRIMKGFMIQGGDPLGTGMGDPGYRFEDEVDNGLQFDQPGLLAMANSGPNTNGSQFFITDSTPDHLNGKHTIFGKCAPTETIKTIISVEVGPRNKPVTDVVLKKVTIQRG